MNALSSPSSNVRRIWIDRVANAVVKLRVVDEFTERSPGAVDFFKPISTMWLAPSFSLG